MTRILIIDDEPGIRSALASIVEDEGYRAFTAADAPAGIQVLEEEDVRLIFLDVLLPKMGGLEALEQIHRDFPAAEVVMISGHANIDMAVRAVKLGAFDFLEKPLSLDKVLTVCRNALTIQKLREENTDLRKKTVQGDEIIGISAPMRKVRDLVRQAAASDARILITGENGTGKEIIARAIHRLSERSARNFVEVNCAAIPDTLIESELFGHEKGAFTDAVSSRRGRFEVANGGTLFMDEIGDMTPAAQAKVLRVIQEQKLERVGSEKTISVDVRLVAATNKNLEAEVARGTFRQDLFFRLNVIPVYIPPLRERQEDIPILLLHFLRELDAGNIELESDAVAYLSAYEWPGNVRELRNLAERIVVMHQGSSIGARALQNLIQQSGSPAPEGDGQAASRSDILDLAYGDARELFEKRYLEHQLAKNGGVIARTAEAIGMYPSNLHAKLRKYNIRTER